MAELNELPVAFHSMSRIQHHLGLREHWIFYYLTDRAAASACESGGADREANHFLDVPRDWPLKCSTDTLSSTESDIRVETLEFTYSSSERSVPIV